jgi:rubredoxin
VTSGSNSGATTSGTGGGGQAPVEPATRFDATPAAWSTPSGGTQDNGYAWVGGGDGYTGDQYWTTMDMTGDGLPDLVVTAIDGVQFGSKGARSWKVYTNTKSGFAAQATTWSTPSGGTIDNGYAWVSGGDGYAGDQYWTTMDMTGDGLPDLVVTATDGVQFGSNGAPSWKVYAGVP